MSESMRTIEELFNDYNPSTQICVDVISNPDDPSDKVEVFEELILIEDSGHMYKVHTASSTFVAPASHKIAVKTD